MTNITQAKKQTSMGDSHQLSSTGSSLIGGQK